MTREVAEMVAPNLPETMQPRLEEGQKIMVAARGINPVLNFALEEAQLRRAVLCVVYVKEIAVYFSGAPAVLGKARWQNDPQAAAIMALMLKEGQARNVCVQPVYAVSEDASATILDLAATLGVDYVILGASQRRTIADLLRGSVATQIAQHLPPSIRLVIFG
jgi:nucleotide-binding universal stress UspA family protein